MQDKKEAKDTPQHSGEVGLNLFDRIRSDDFLASNVTGEFFKVEDDTRATRAKSSCVGCDARRKNNMPALDKMLCNKLKAIAPVAMDRQTSVDYLKVSIPFIPQSGKEKQKFEIQLANHLWANISFPHLLSHMRGYLSPIERMRFNSVSKLWNDPLSNLNITELQVLRRPQFTDDHFRRILKKHQNLRHINLLGCCRLTDRTLEKMSIAIPKLKELNISYCLLVTDSGIRHLAECPRLTLLHTAACNKVTDEGLEYLYEKCPVLKRPFMPIPRLTRQHGAYGTKPYSLEGKNFERNKASSKNGANALRPPPIHYPAFMYGGKSSNDASMSTSTWASANANANYEWPPEETENE
mmetsp:Transcript_12637/g.31059  ORF Transcript_12637/g.31059 Transcript_12637/m.31059 type:complete len:353 (-) Transcript_12637:211-1269(-)